MAERDLQRRRAPMAVRSNARAELQHGGTGWAQWARAGAADAPLQDGRTQARPADGFFPTVFSRFLGALGGVKTSFLR
jgi:hypothetical protein